MGKNSRKQFRKKSTIKSCEMYGGGVPMAQNSKIINEEYKKINFKDNVTEYTLQVLYRKKNVIAIYGKYDEANKKITIDENGIVVFLDLNEYEYGKYNEEMYIGYGPFDITTSNDINNIIDVIASQSQDTINYDFKPESTIKKINRLINITGVDTKIRKDMHQDNGGRSNLKTILDYSDKIKYYNEKDSYKDLINFYKDKHDDGVPIAIFYGRNEYKSNFSFIKFFTTIINDLNLNQEQTNDKVKQMIINIFIDIFKMDSMYLLKEKFQYKWSVENQNNDNQKKVENQNNDNQKKIKYESKHCEIIGFVDTHQGNLKLTSDVKSLIFKGDYYSDSYDKTKERYLVSYRDFEMVNNGTNLGFSKVDEYKLIIGVYKYEYDEKKQYLDNGYNKNICVLVKKRDDQDTYNLTIKYYFDNEPTSKNFKPRIKIPKYKSDYYFISMDYVIESATIEIVNKLIVHMLNASGTFDIDKFYIDNGLGNDKTIDYNIISRNNITIKTPISSEFSDSGNDIDLIIGGQKLGTYKGNTTNHMRHGKGTMTYDKYISQGYGSQLTAEIKNPESGSWKNDGFTMLSSVTSFFKSKGGKKSRKIQKNSKRITYKK